MISFFVILYLRKVLVVIVLVDSFWEVGVEFQGKCHLLQCSRVLLFEKLLVSS